MKTALEEYMEAREDRAVALKLEVMCRLKLEQSRFRFRLAKEALRAEESEMLETKVIV